jgi:mannosyltransferase
VFSVIAARQEPGDAIAYLEPDWRFQLQAATEYYLPETRPRHVFEASSAREAGWWVGTECPAPADCLGDTRRIWLVRLAHADGEPLAGVDGPKGRLLREQFDIVQTARSGQLQVVLLRRTPGR